MAIKRFLLFLVFPVLLTSGLLSESHSEVLGGRERFDQNSDLRLEDGRRFDKRLVVDSER